MSRLHANSVDADTSAWGGSVDAIPLAGQTAVPDADDEEVSAADVIEKEQLVKELIQKQDGLKALLDRITDVNTTTSKLKTDNEMLQTYIDNLTRNNAMGAVKR